MAGLAAVTVDPVSATGACMGVLVLSQHELACLACQDLFSRWSFWKFLRAFHVLPPSTSSSMLCGAPIGITEGFRCEKG